LACILGQQRGFYPPPDYNQANTEHHYSQQQQQQQQHQQQQQQQYSQQQQQATYAAYVPQPGFSTGSPWQTADKNRDVCLGSNTHRTAEPKQPKEKRKERNAALRKVGKKLAAVPNLRTI